MLTVKDLTKYKIIILILALKMSDINAGQDPDQ